MTNDHDATYRDPRGSMWRRWEPHIHTPGTAQNDQFGPDSLEDYIARLEDADPAVEVLGVTDYYGIECYERVVAQKATGRLPGVATIFPNIEMRLTSGTKSGSAVNLHLLVSSDELDHIERINDFLAQLVFKYGGESYPCNRAGLVRLGRAHDPSQTDDGGAYRVGVRQFKVDFRHIEKLLADSKWMQRNALVAIEVGTQSGTSGVPDASFAALRAEMEAFAHIILSSSEADRQFWAGESKHIAKEIREKYRSLKPCLHGCDAHALDEVARPKHDRYCWIKGDPTFDALRQACIEPRGRAVVSTRQPPDGSAERAILRAATPRASWFMESGVSLHPGLVAVIGARGSGKTALADVLAHVGGCRTVLDNEESFLVRAATHLDGVVGQLDWSPKETIPQSLTSRPVTDWPDVHYLSQQFVERLCSAQGPTDELLSEVEKVVFSAHEAADRLEATDFDGLLDAKIGDTTLRIAQLRDRLDRLADRIRVARQEQGLLPDRQRQLAKLKTLLDDDRRVRKSLLGSGQTDRIAYYERLQAAVTDRQRQVQALQHRRQTLDHLAAEVERFETDVFPSLHGELKERYSGANLADPDWREFAPVFRGDVRAVLARSRTQAEQLVADASRGVHHDPPTQATTVEILSRTSLSLLEAALAEVAKQIGIDRAHATKLKTLNNRIATREQEIQKHEREIAHFSGAEARLDDARTERDEAYRDLFQVLADRQSILGGLYRPLESRLLAQPSLARLRLKVSRTVDIGQWAAGGEDLLDLRKEGAFKGRGALEDAARRELLPAWSDGSAETVADAMAAFRARYDRDLLKLANVPRDDPDFNAWTLRLGRWLYSTDHVQIQYEFEYDDLPLSQLSPGMRGIVLLLLYLALDQEDHRPLIIDQPEENLDPRTIYEDLVQLFRETRSRRQVIIVTHNANLVVNTDVDQVIVASCTKGAAGSPPEFTYESGGLENEKIRDQVCAILEGGEEAFRERAKRLRLVLF
jgi:energy-coupling factor transporter ATP-binding protein EcfA2